MNLFYLKRLWEDMKTPSFAHEIGESALAGVGRNNTCEYFLFERESALAGVGRNNVCAYLLLEIALGRHENTKFCTRNWRIRTGRGGQE